jgi:hypothetical protein
MMPNTSIQDSWRDSIQALPWNPNHAWASAVNALSQLDWHGVPENEAFDFIQAIPAASWLRKDPSLLFEAWQHVRQQMTGESIVLLELEPIFDTAA